uniref:Uncharacterized protein n=1 Tax=Geladintestivirus 5 TaxID=3233137 RepID=A0AAU8MHC8_9CAUD
MFPKYVIILNNIIYYTNKIYMNSIKNWTKTCTCCNVSS